ncbi:MAG TPA: ATP-binding cassette domain-containing protein [Gemmatimonadaceae bacterium]
MSHWYGAQRALDTVSLTVPSGGVLAIVGESGSGKTTVLRCFNRLVDPRQGSITIDGQPVRDEPVEQLRRRIGYVPQHGGLLPHWTIRRNVALVPVLSGAGDARRAADEALGMVGLDPHRFGDRLPRELSGGQRQRAALARAFAARQEVVLLDEPFGALDAISRSDVHETFEAVRRELAFTALLVTHDLAEAARLADRIAVMRNGRVEQEGAVAEVQRSPASPYVAELFARAQAAHAALAGAGR